MAGEGGGGDGEGAGEEDGGGHGAHAAGEVAVGGGDADFGAVEAAEGVGGAAEAGGAAGGTDEAAGVAEDVFDGFFVGAFGDAAEVEFFHVGVDFGGAGDDEGGDFDLVTLEDVGGEDHVGDFSAGAGADVGLVEFGVADVVGGVFVVGGMGLGDHGFHGGEVVVVFVTVFRAGVVFVDVPFLDAGTGADVLEGFFVDVTDAVFAAGFDGHVGEGHAVFEGERADAFAGEVHGFVGGAGDGDVADDGEDEVFGGEVRGDFSVEGELHGGGHFEPGFSGAEGEGGVGVPDAGSEHAEGAGGAGVGVGAEHDFAGADVAFLGECFVADAFVVGFVGVEVGVGLAGVHGDEFRVVVVGEVLLFDEVAEDLDVAMRFFVGGEDIVIGDDDHSVLVPDFGVFAELFVENADGAGAADVVGHEDVDVDPDVFAGGDVGFAGVLGHYFFGHGHGCGGHG